MSKNRDRWLALGVIGLAIELFIVIIRSPGDFSLRCCGVRSTRQDRWKFHVVLAADALVVCIIPGESDGIWQEILGEASDDNVCGV